MNGYVRVHQTWSFVQKTEQGAGDTHGNVKVDVSDALDDLRHRVQVARVEKGWRLQELATRVGFDASVLADFERGDDPLTSERRRSLCKVLGL